MYRRSERLDIAARPGAPKCESLTGITSVPQITPPCNNVLVVDHEPSRNVLRTSLSAYGFTVAEARSGEEALGAAQNQTFDLVVLEIHMPGIGGVETCRRLRDLTPRAGIVMITSHDQEGDEVRALEAGADDYVTKPFRLRQLIARLQAVLRRTSASDLHKPQLLQAGSLAIDLHRRILWRSGKQVHLSAKEFGLLAFMMQNQGTRLTHLTLLRSVWGSEYGDKLEYLRSYVRMLRKKIEEDPAKPEYILTEPRFGYRFWKGV